MRNYVENWEIIWEFPANPNHITGKVTSIVPITIKITSPNVSYVHNRKLLHHLQLLPIRHFVKDNILKSSEPVYLRPETVWTSGDLIFMIHLLQM